MQQWITNRRLILTHQKQNTPGRILKFSFTSNSRRKSLAFHCRSVIIRQIQAMSKLILIPVVLLSLLLASCSTPELQPASAWPTEALERPMHDVQVIKYLPGGVSAKGSGIIVHSSNERGTYILTCGHIACFTPEMPLQTTIAETAGTVGRRYTTPKGTPMSVRIHERSATGQNAKWKEWHEFTGEVLYAEFMLKSWPYNTGTYKYTENESPKPEILDVALIHLRTGAEPLRTAKIGSGFWPDYGTAAGVSYNTNRPETENIFAINESVFFFDGEYSSGFGVYDRDHRLGGVYVSKMGLDQGVLQIGNRVYKPTEQYHFVPIRTIRDALGAAGYGWILD